MRLIRFEDHSGAIQYGEPTTPGMARPIRGDIFANWTLRDEEVAVSRLLAPVAPPNVIAIGLNYRKHAEETGAAIPSEPLIFAKLTSSVIAHGDPIILPAEAPSEVDFEAELAVVIGTLCRNVSEADALNYVLGYTCANDVSARDCQRRRDKQWTRGKSFDTFCPLGPHLVIDAGLNPNALRIRSQLDDQEMQNSSTADMIFSVPYLVSYLSHQFTLLPGTVILTGTPEGVGIGRNPPKFLRPGDTFTVEIEGIGTLTNPVKAAHTA
jgi:2-keto-4-pentenoate hydratase/2-oxohepta-3-ene-1,7-dioic acid hydratase in catechol pathway